MLTDGDDTDVSVVAAGAGTAGGGGVEGVEDAGNATVLAAKEGASDDTATDVGDGTGADTSVTRTLGESCVKDWFDGDIAVFLDAAGFMAETARFLLYFKLGTDAVELVFVVWDPPADFVAGTGATGEDDCVVAAAVPAGA